MFSAYDIIRFKRQQPEIPGYPDINLVPAGIIGMIVDVTNTGYIILTGNPFEASRTAIIAEHEINEAIELLETPAPTDLLPRAFWRTHYIDYLKKYPNA